MFVHLHNHSDYSLLDGAIRIPQLVRFAVEQKAPAVGLTDHGNLFGALDFYSAAKQAGIKPIIGCELYLTAGSRHQKKAGQKGEMRYHQVLFAKNEIGYKNLSYLSSEAYISGFYYKPRIDKELLRKHHEGLICLSSCLQGEIPQLLVDNNLDSALEAVEFYKDVFGDDFYLELQRHGIPSQEKIIPELAQFAYDKQIKLVATNDAHYYLKEHAGAHDILLCVGTQAKIDEPNRMHFDTEEFFLKTPQEMEELFADFPEAVANTLEIAGKCNLEIDLETRHFPVFSLPGDKEWDADSYLRHIAEKGLHKRYDDNPSQDIIDRFDYELGVISQTGFSNYFLIVWDFVRWAKEHAVPVGPGRGSAAGCLVSYCLGITNLDPIRYGLIFERFLNPERVKPPDIDIDFSDDRREEVIGYVREKYGHDSVCRITTFGRMAAKSAVRDVARAIDLSFAEADKIARLIPEGPNVTIQSALKEVPDLRSLVDSNPRYRQVIDNALIMEGAIRHASTHAAGVVICPGKTADFVPVYTQGGEREVYTQFDMNWVEEAGLLKIDFLGLQTLQEIDLTIKSLQKQGIEIDLENLPTDDPAAFRIFGEGDTIGIFQFESSGMRDNLVKLKPERLNDLLAMNALYRPGPIQYIDEYIACRHGRKKPSYIHQSLKPILEETYGVIVYQEQVIRIATDLAGFSLGKADNLRWAMGKKKMELMQSLEMEFVQGCIANSIDKKTADAIYKTCEQFANYGFVKAHAAGYALIAYQCAYMKAHYPANFLAACLTVRRKNSTQVLKLLAECRKKGIAVLPPDINDSEHGFTATEQGVRFGMAAVRNVGDAAVNALLDARKEHGHFTSLHHFLISVDLRCVNKKVVESLIEAGAFDMQGPNRATLLESLPGALAYAQAIHDERIRGQTTLFGGVGVDPAVHIPPPDFHHREEWEPAELRAREKHVLGYYISSHPLDSYRLEIDGLSSHRLADKDEFHHDTHIRICGVIVAVNRRTTKNGDQMAILTVEDLTGSIDGLLFPSAFQKFGEFAEDDKMVGVVGKISKQSTDDDPKIRIDELVSLEDALEHWGHALRLSMPNDLVTEPLVGRIERILQNNPGKCPVYIDLAYKSGDVRSLRVGRFSVKPGHDMIENLANLIGRDQVRLKA